MNDGTNDRIRDEAIELLLKVEKAPEDPSLRAALAEWRARGAAHERAYQSVARMWRVAGGLGADRPAETGRAPAPKPPRHRNAARRLDRVRRRPVRAAVAAAMACLLLFLAYPTLRTMVQSDHATPTGERRTVTLADGSTVYLDAASAIAVDLSTAGRTVSLIAGEAYFDVAHDRGRPFEVRAEGLTVTVRGTAFTVGKTQESTTVAVREGLVEVRAANGVPRFLHPGDRLTFDESTGQLALSSVMPANVGAWRGGDLVVDGVPLSEVAERIGRYHRGMILVSDDTLARRKITGVFKLQDPVAALSAAAETQYAGVSALSPYLLRVAPR